MSLQALLFARDYAQFVLRNRSLVEAINRVLRKRAVSA
jgi:hypothetical protein